MNIRLNKEKSIGKVLYVVEGGKAEPYLLYKIFCNIMDYQMETILREKGYHKYNSKQKPTSQVFVINAEESNIKNIDRDNQSNTDPEFISKMLSVLTNSRDNDQERQGLLLLSYPSIEAFTLSNFVDQSFKLQFDTGSRLKQYLHEHNINHSHITEDTLIHAAQELINAIDEMDLGELDIDAFGEYNREIFSYKENEYEQEALYKALSLLCVSLIDLGVIEVIHEMQEQAT